MPSLTSIYYNITITEYNKHQSLSILTNQRLMVLIMFLWPAEVRVQEWEIAKLAPDRL